MHQRSKAERASFISAIIQFSIFKSWYIYVPTSNACPASICSQQIRSAHRRRDTVDVGFAQASNVYFPAHFVSPCEIVRLFVLVFCPILLFLCIYFINIYLDLVLLCQYLKWKKRETNMHVIKINWNRRRRCRSFVVNIRVFRNWFRVVEAKK